jgi:hypothetical protein
MTQNNEVVSAPPPASQIVPYYGWLEEIGKCRGTGHRWRQQFPWLRVINVFGRLYISREMIAEFERRAFSGELARDIAPRA